ncbi:MAG: hypothetical protein KAY32_15590 [Candidatus Eisenbacteria sp.]|nr:hypothetical protein [Candidatus Eisenbacteria bacterium]
MCYEEWVKSGGSLVPDDAVLKLQKRYHKRYREYINWPLTRPLSLGDMGRWSSGKTFSYEQNISDLGVALETRTGAVLTSRGFTTKGGTSTKFKAAGEAPDLHTALVKARAGVSISLSARYACVLRANVLIEESVANRDEAGSTLMALDKDERWWKHRIVVTAILRADAATVALSHSSAQRVDINAGVDCIVPFDLADAELSLEIGFQGEDTSIDLVARDVVLAFQLSKVKKGKWWHSWAASQAFEPE